MPNGNQFLLADPSGEKILDITDGDYQATNGAIGHSITFNADGTVAAVNNGAAIVNTLPNPIKYVLKLHTTKFNG